MRLFHYTSGNALRSISKHGLTIGDVPTDIKGHRGEIGVWLTTSEEAEGHGLENSRVDKKRYRIEVAIDDLSRPELKNWLDWAKANVTAETAELLHMAPGAMPETWFVYFGWIKPKSIVAVVDSSTGKALEDWKNAWPEAEDVTGVPYWARHMWHKKMIKAVRRALQVRHSPG